MLFRHFVAITLLVTSSISVAQQPPSDVADKVIADLFRRFNAHYLCMPQGASRESVREALKDRLIGVNTNDDASGTAIATAIYTTFPCPFSPFRSELRLAKAGDLTGIWLFPEDSQRFRYGPKSPAWQSQPGMPPVKCEGVSYLEGGSSLVAQIVGKLPCPTSNDMRTWGKTSKVEAWSLIRDGRVKIGRTDISDHIEEWDIFVVENAFEFAQTRFVLGDLVSYRRREKGNEFNATTMFRHLQRLP